MSEQPPESLDAVLRQARTPHSAYEAMRRAMTALGREHFLHIQFYKGDLVRDLAHHVAREIDVVRISTMPIAYYRVSADAFYSEVTHQRMGQAFYDKNIAAFRERLARER